MGEGDGGAGCGWGGRERENVLFHLSMHSLVDIHMCPDWGLNLQP